MEDESALFDYTFDLLRQSLVIYSGIDILEINRVNKVDRVVCEIVMWSVGIDCTEGICKTVGCSECIDKDYLAVCSLEGAAGRAMTVLLLLA